VKYDSYLRAVNIAKHRRARVRILFSKSLPSIHCIGHAVQQRALMPSHPASHLYMLFFSTSSFHSRKADMHLSSVAALMG
jgi:hypothetical protein